MLTATHSGFWRWLSTGHTKTEARALPSRGRTPLFIHDAIHPWNGSTMLLEILRSDQGNEETPEH